MFSVDSEIRVRLKSQLRAILKRNTTANVVMQSPIIVKVPSNSSYGQLRHKIGLAFHLPSDLPVAIYFSDSPKALVNAGNANQALQCHELAIDFDLQTCVKFWWYYLAF